MEKFPAKYANTFRSELCAVFRLLNEGSKKETELRTLRTRRTHFLWWCHQRGILPHIFPINKETKLWDTEMLNMTMASYAVFLATGHTIRSQSIKAATILVYIYATKGFNKKKIKIITIIKKKYPVDRDT